MSRADRGSSCRRAPIPPGPTRSRRLCLPVCRALPDVRAAIRPSGVQRIAFHRELPVACAVLPHTAMGPTVDTGDTAFVLMSCALVLFMTPGLAFFYAGLVRSKNVLNTLLMSF